MFKTCKTLNRFGRPYLNLKERLSQIWFNYYTIFLLLLVLKLLIFKISLDHSLSESREQTYSACQAAEKYTSYIASVPHYISKYTNVLIANSMKEAHKQMISALNLALTASKNMILFTINLSIGTYLCLLTAAVDTTVDTALNATESIIDVANETVISFANDLDDGLGDISTIANKIISTIDDAVDAVKDLFGSDDSGNDLTDEIGQVNLTISSLRSWHISGSINTKLESLKNKTLDFDDVKSKTNSLISTPFEMIQKQVNQKANKTFSADELYIPPVKNLTFCNSSKEIDEFYDRAAKVVYKTSLILMIILIVAMLVFMIYQSWIEYRGWKHILEAATELQYDNKDGIEKLNPFFEKRHNIAILDAFQNRNATIISNGLIWLFFRKKDLRSSKTATKIARLRWLINYCSSSYSLPILLLGILGLLSFGFQSIILDFLAHIKTDDVKPLVNKVSKSVSASINDSVSDWCNHTNSYILDYQDEINNSTLGWVHNVTSSVNNTVTTFISEMNTKLDDIFGGTIMYEPIQGVVGCILTRKLQQITKAMTWVNKNSQVSFETIDPDKYIEQVWNNDGNQTNQNGIKEELSSVENKVAKAIKTILQDYRKSLRIELYISLGLIGLWLVIIFFGVVILSVTEYRRSKSDEGNEMHENEYQMKENSTFGQVASKSADMNSVSSSATLSPSKDKAEIDNSNSEGKLVRKKSFNYNENAYWENPFECDLSEQKKQYQSKPYIIKQKLGRRSNSSRRVFFQGGGVINKALANILYGNKEKKENQQRSVGKSERTEYEPEFQETLGRDNTDWTDIDPSSVYTDSFSDPGTPSARRWDP